ncbi:MAG: hypothetical protein J5563_08585 [Clostridia bacterium]|nr:hypothetical protein [Clostridia bacterium]
MRRIIIKIICLLFAVLFIASFNSCSFKNQDNATSEIVFCKNGYISELQYGLSGYNVFHTGITIFGLNMDPPEHFNCLLRTDGTLSDFSYGSKSQFEKREKYELKIRRKISDGDYGEEIREWYNSFQNYDTHGFEQFGFVRLPDSAFIIIQYMAELTTENYLIKVDTDFNELHVCCKFIYNNEDKPISSQLISVFDGNICIQNFVWFDFNLTKLELPPYRIPDLKEEKSNAEEWLISNGYGQIAESVYEHPGSFFFRKVNDTCYYSFLAAKPEGGEGFNRYFCEFKTDGELLRIICCSDTGAQSVVLLSADSSQDDWFEI